MSAPIAIHPRRLRFLRRIRLGGKTGVGPASVWYWVVESDNGPSGLSHGDPGYALADLAARHSGQSHIPRSIANV